MWHIFPPHDQLHDLLENHSSGMSRIMTKQNLVQILNLTSDSSKPTEMKPIHSLSAAGNALGEG